MADGGGPARAEFSSTAVGRRLAMCAELAGLKRGQSNLRAAAAAKRRHRAHAILRLLLPGEAGAGAPTDALYSRASAAQLFSESIEAARSASAAGRVRAGLLLKDLQRMALAAVASDDMPLQAGATFPAVPAEFLVSDPDSPHKDDSPAQPVVDESRSLGAMPEGLIDSVKQAIEANPYRRITTEDLQKVAPDKVAEFQAATAEVSDSWARTNALRGSSEYDAQYAAYRAAADREWALRQELEAVGAAELQRRKDVVAATVADYASEVMASSDVTEEQAAAWASQQVVITPAAARRLKKQGYDPAQVVSDAAEFYRFARGRVEKVVIDTAGDRRANASSIDAHGTAGKINLGSTFDKRVLWHELGHHVEADPVAAMAARLFIRLRSVDGKTYSLRKLTGHKGYDAREVAFKNGFFHPYVGKVYRHGSTEVFSMGIESFSDPYLLATRIAKDPETFEFVTGYLRSPKSALQRLHLAMRQSMREGGEAAQASAAEESGSAIARDVAKITDFITADKLPAEAGDWARMVMRDSVVGYLSAAKDGVYYVLAKGRWRHPKTRRMGKVFRLYKVEPDATNLPVAYDAFPLNEPEIARLALAAWRQTGIQPRYEHVASGEFTLEG
ncbi:MAG TPA: hypothetical protein VIG97_05745 [Luteimonas sp.]